MNTPLFPNGIKGLADSKHSAYEGECDKLVGIDFRSTPGVIKAHQKLTKISEEIVNELCKNVVELEDGTKLWFSSESGKIWKQSGDTFTLIHTIIPATDYKEINSIVSGFEDTPEYMDIENGITMSIAENSAVYGLIEDNIPSVIDTEGSSNAACELSSGVYVVAYQGVDNDGFVKSFTVNSSLLFSQLAVLEHDTSNNDENSICRIDDTHFMVAYEGGALNYGYVKTFSAISTTITQINSLQHDTNSEDNSIIQLDATHYALAYSGGASNYGYIKIFTIDGSYVSTQTSQLIHDSSGTTSGHKLVKIDNTHIMLAYIDSTQAQIIKTFAIDGSWNVTEVDSLTHALIGGETQSLVQMDATHYVWSGQVASSGYMKAFTINGSYEISEVDYLNIQTFNFFPSLMKTDESHLVLSSANSTMGYTKVFSLNITNNKLKELSSIDFTGGNDSSILRAGRHIMTVHTTSSSNYINITTINETFSNGIILKPSDTEEIKLIASKIVSEKIGINQYLKATIKIPEGYSDLDMVVITGRAGEETYPPTGVTVEGDSMTQLNSRTTTYGFKCSSSYYNLVNPATGDNDIIIDFGTTSTYVYGVVLVFANVHQTVPISTTVDYGWKDYLQLPGVTKNELRLGAFLSKVNTHYSGGLQKEAVQEDIAEDTDRYTISVSMRKFGIGTAKTLGACLFSYLTTEVVGDEDNSYIPEEQKQKIYYANEDILFAIPVEKINTWADDVETIGEFRYGDDTYHSMVKQNLELYIGDKTVLAKVNSDGEFIPETALNVRSPERIQVLSPYDTDILIGTKTINKARVLRWDTFSDSWIADDDVIETGINAFILDDDYTYVSAGDFGHTYFYNGEKLNITKKIPGTWDSTHKGKINANAVGYLKGTPVFGLSNTIGNPTLQGIYGFGGYDSKYPKSLSLDYPLPTDEFSGIEIGCININGADMLVSYKTGIDVGIAKLDHTTKYNNAYLETALLGSLGDRDGYTIHEGICADYISLPTNTEVELSVKTKYDIDYTELDTIVDSNILSVQTKASIPDTLNLQVKVNLVSSGNNSPELENIGIL